MRSFLRGSLGGVSATSATAGAYFGNPQQKDNHAQVAPMNAAPNAVRGTHAMVQPMMPPIFDQLRHAYGHNTGFPPTSGSPRQEQEEQEQESSSSPHHRMISGRVAKWFDARGFGFIEDPLGQTQYFVHARDLVTVEGGHRSLFPGQVVEFEPEQTENGGHALRVCGPGGAPLHGASAAASTIVADLPPPPSYSATTASGAAVAAAPVGGETAAEQPAATTTSNPTTTATEEDTALPQPRVFGSIAHWTVDKGYGFVAVPGQDDHYFTHIKDFTCKLPHMSPSMPDAGLEVEFTPSTAGSKRRATHVTLPHGIPFEPNTVVVASSTSSSTTAAQQQQHMSASSKRHGPSALAMALAPEKFVVPPTVGSEAPNNGGAVPPQQSSSKSSGSNSAKPQQSSFAAAISPKKLVMKSSGDEQVVSPMAPSQLQQQQKGEGDPSSWHAGYSTGFVDGQHYLKQEVSNLGVSAPTSIPLPRSTQQQQQQGVAPAGKTGGSFPPPSERKSYQKLAAVPQRSNNAGGSSNRSRSTSPASINNSKQQQPTTASSTAATSSTTSPKWFSSNATNASWASQTATPSAREEHIVAASASTSADVTAPSSETTSPTAQQARGVGFPTMPHQRGGFSSFGRGAANGGRGRRGRGW